MRLSRTRTRAAGRQVDSRPLFDVHPLESRLCLATVHDVDFLAGNYSFDDPAFLSQPASNVNVRAVEIKVPDDMVQPVPPIYRPSGFGIATFGWERPKTMTRPKPNSPIIVSASATSQIQVTAALGKVPKGMSPEAYLTQVATQYTSAGYTLTDGPATTLVPWRINGGQFDGKEPWLNGIVAFYVKTTSLYGLDLHQQSMAQVVPAGYAPDGAPVYYSITLTVESRVTTGDTSVIPLEEASAQLLQAASPAVRDQELFNTTFPSLQYAGAIPETLFFYDFSHRATEAPSDVRYLDQFEQASLPIRYGVHGGNAAGPLSVTMALDKLGTPPSVEAVYGSTMELGAAVQPETPQEFDWTRARRVVQTYLGDSATVVNRNKDTWARIERNLKAGAQVVLRTNLGQDVTPGDSHPILLLDVGTDPNVKTAVEALYGTGDYFVVADPGGNYFADATHGGLDVGHYGTVNALRSKVKGITYGGGFAVYPKAELQRLVSPLRTLTISPADPTMQVQAHSPVLVVITDPLGRKTGIRPDGSVLEEIPESEYQVAVLEEEGSGVVTLDPEEEKGVVMSNPAPGTYQVDLVGTGTGPYTLDVSTSLPGQPRAITTYAGTVTPGATAHYTFTVAGAGAPQVQQVFADSTAWSPSFRQFMQTSGAGDGALGYRVNAGDTLPWVNVDRLVLRFDRELPAAQLPAKVIIDGTRADYAATPSVLDARTILLNLDRPLGATGGERFRLADDGLGGSPDFRFNTLPGDVDRSGTVLANDFSQVKQKFFSGASNPGSGASAYSIFHDVNGSGSILADDFSAVKSRFFNTLPGGVPTAAATAFLDGSPIQPLPRPRLIDALAP